MPKMTNRTKKLFAALAVLCWLVFAPAWADCPLANPADCIYVDDDCPGDPGTGTAADPFCRIQDAYDSVFATTTPADPATILVRAGTYNECPLVSGFDFDPDFNLDRPVHLVADAWLLAGQPDPDPADTQPFEDVVMQTLITGQGICDADAIDRLPTISIAGTGASLRGFAITEGGDSGVEAFGSVDLSNNLLFMNEAFLGGGAFVATEVCVHGDVTARVEHNVVRDNLALDFEEEGFGDGGGIFAFANGSDFDTNCIGGNSSLTIAHNVVHGNTAQNAVIGSIANDTFAAGGGIAVETFTELPFGPPEDSRVDVRIFHNSVFDNTLALGEDGLGFGAGIYASAQGFGMETIEVEENEVGPSNIGAAAGTGTAFGGGISIAAEPLLFGLHEVVIDRNFVFQNSADVGGGIDLLALADDLDTDQRLVVRVTNNRIESNDSLFEGGGINAEFNSSRSLDIEDEATLFPGAPLVAEETSFLLRGNDVRNNSSGTAGAGVVLRPFADADPLFAEFGSCFSGEQRPATAIIDFENNLVLDNTANGNTGVHGQTGCDDPACESVICDENFGDPFCCEVVWDSFCADDAAVEPFCDCDTSNCCESSLLVTIGAGILAIPSANGETRAAVRILTSTVADNTMTADGFVGGVEIAARTTRDCRASGSILGTAELTVERSIVTDNHANGIGGPDFDPVDTDLLLTVIKTSSYGNEDENYEETLFPGNLPPDGNILDDPLLDPVTRVPELCSSAYDVGSCESVPETVCFSDADCTAPPTDECIAEGAGYFASPDINNDDALDGVDLLRFSATFGAEDGVDARYNPDADLDRNGQVEGPDLDIIAPKFGQECTPAP